MSSNNCVVCCCFRESLHYRYPKILNFVKGSCISEFTKSNFTKIIEKISEPKLHFVTFLKNQFDFSADEAQKSGQLHVFVDFGFRSLKI